MYIMLSYDSVLIAILFMIVSLQLASPVSHTVNRNVLGAIIRPRHLCI